MVDRNIIEKSLDEIRTRRAEIDEQMNALKHERASLHPAETALMHLLEAMAAIPGMATTSISTVKTRRSSGRVTVTDRLFEAIRQAGEGGRTVEQLKADHPDIKEPTMYSSLRHLRNDQRVRQEEGVYFVPPTEDTAAPQEQPQEATEQPQERVPDADRPYDTSGAFIGSQQP